MNLKRRDLYKPHIEQTLYSFLDELTDESVHIDGLIYHEVVKIKLMVKMTTNVLSDRSFNIYNEFESGDIALSRKSESLRFDYQHKNIYKTLDEKEKFVEKYREKLQGKFMKYVKNYK